MLPQSDVNIATTLGRLAQVEGLTATHSVMCTLPAYCASMDGQVRAKSAEAKGELALR